jgi:pectinesterase
MKRLAARCLTYVCLATSIACGGSQDAPSTPTPAPASGGATDVGCTAPRATAGTADRPQLTASEATAYTEACTFGTGPGGADPWLPSASPIASPSEATFTVAADGSGTQRTVQAAIDAAVARGGSARLTIRVRPAAYREVVVVPSGAPPITLYGENSDASLVTIVYDNANPTPITASTCPHISSSSGTCGTSGSATFTVNAASFQAKNLTFANDYAEESYASSNQSAVAFAGQGDKTQLENVSFLGNQDTLLLKSSSAGVIARHYLRNCYVEGDTDFVFGRGVVVLDGGTVRYLNRKPGTAGYIFAPSTATTHLYGMLAKGVTFTSDSGSPVYLGRPWEEGMSSSPQPNPVPRGQVTVRDSKVSGVVNATTPWARGTNGGDPQTAGRLYEYNNN